MKLFGLIGVSILLTFTSCVKELDYQNNQKPGIKASLHTFLNPDSASSIELNRVVNITEKITGIDDAIIEITNVTNSVKSNFVHSKDGTYSGALNIASNDILNLNVQWDDQQYFAQTIVPNKPLIDTAFSELNFVGSVGYTRLFNFTLTDLAASNDFYRLYLMTKKMVYTLNSNNAIIDSSIIWEKSSISGEEIGFIRNSYNTYTTKELLFSDESFNGLTSSFVFYLTKPNNESNSKVIQHRIVLENLPLELFDYYNSRNAHLWQQSSITQSPTPLSGNIPKMYGVFSAYNLTEYLLNY